MTDRELLELAAKAAGMKPGHAHGEYAWHPILECLSTLDDRNREQPWNPLEDDGDALRLAVKLGLGLMFIPANESCDEPFVNVSRPVGSALRDGLIDCYEHHGADPFAATRRAIVRAAAALAA